MPILGDVAAASPDAKSAHSLGKIRFDLKQIATESFIVAIASIGGLVYQKKSILQNE